MRYLFNVLPRAGHLNASVALARELCAGGDTVTFFCSERPDFVEQRLKRAGLDCACLGPRTSVAARPAASRAAMTQRLRDPRWRRRFFEYSFATAIEPQLAALRHAIRDVGADVVCTDAMSDAGAIAAELEHLPWAAVTAMMDIAAPADFTCAFRTSLDEIVAARAAAAQAAGATLRYWWSNALSPALNLVFVEPLAPGQLAALPHTHLVGPPALAVRGDEPPFPWDRLRPDLPLVYISSGTELAWDDAVVADLERAATSLGAQVVVAPVESAHAPPADGVIRVAYAPQPALLARAAVAITHGGTNSVMESLAHGVPMLVLPIDYDQPVSALLVEQAGLGAALDPADYQPTRARELLQALLAPGAPERARCRAFAAQLAARDGARTAADLLRATFG